MNIKRFMIAIVAISVLISPCQVKAQLARKAGSAIWRNVMRKSAGEGVETAGEKIVKSATGKIGKSGGAVALRKGSATPAKSLAGSAGNRMTARYGDDAARALDKVSSQNARRLMMLESEIADSPYGSQLMTMIAKGGKGDQIVDFLWRNKATIAGGTLLATLVVNPDKVLGASSDAAATVIEATGREVAAPIARDVVRPAVHWMGIAFVMLLVLATVAWLIHRYFTPQSQPAAGKSKSEPKPDVHYIE
jgi:hypothetical protein